MTAKATFKRGLHDSRRGELVQHVGVDCVTLEKIERTIGRPLLPDHTKRINEIVEAFTATNVGGETVSNQEVVVTLQAISKEPDDLIQDAFENCDEQTHCAITRALYRMGERRFRGGYPPARIKAAALLALSELPKGAPGRPRNDRRARLLAVVAPLWREITGEEGKAWTDGSGAASPMLTFAALLLCCVEPGWKRGGLEDQDLSALAKQLRTINA